MNRNDWNLAHKACPKCGNADLKQSLVGVIEIDGNYEDNINTAECSKCGWGGFVNQLVPTGSAVTGAAQQMPIRILDFQGETYASTKDIVVAMLDFNKKLNATLPREDMQKFTDAIFKEITGMVITVDKQHWVNKYNYQAQLQEEVKKQAKDKLDGKPEETPKAE